MNNKVFGEVTFNTGWKRKQEIVLFGQKFSIIIKIKAYFEKDGITEEQEASFAAYNKDKMEKLSEIEKLITKFTDERASFRFIPQVLLFERNGDYALLLDDVDNPDEGIAVTLSPKQGIVLQDEYL